MPIPYTLHENHLTNDPDDYLAHSASLGAAEETALLDDMEKRGSNLIRADMVAFLELYYGVILDRLLAGYRVNTPVVNMSTSIQGAFFVASDGTAAHTEMVMQNKPARLMLMVPTLDAGDYTLEVRV